MQNSATNGSRQRSWLDLHRVLFFAVTCVGAMMLLVALLVPFTPLFVLENVLTDAELRDAAKRESTLELLDKANTNNYAVAFGGFGAVVIMLGGIGLFARPCGQRAS